MNIPGGDKVHVSRLVVLLSSLVLLASCKSAPTENSHTQLELQPSPGATLYKTHCASCHGNKRLGEIGPALLPVSLKRVKKNRAETIIKNGLPLTQMPAFSDVLGPDDIRSIVEFIYTNPAKSPQWKSTNIKKSWELQVGWQNWKRQPLVQDMLNLFMVVESGDHHISLLDGKTHKILHRFASRRSLHGGIKYSPDGRYAYFTSRDGWVTSYDLYTRKKVAEIRAGLNTRNIAISGNGQYVAVGNYLPHSMVILKAPSLELQKVLPTQTLDNQSSRVSAVYSAPPRKSFIVALKDVAELWEVDYQNRFAVRRITLGGPLDDFFFNQSYTHLIGASRQKGAWVVDLNQGRLVKEIPLSGMPHLGAGISWNYKGKRVIASPNLRKNQITILDASNWEVIKQLPTKGPGFFLRSHENSRYAWADVFFGPNKDLVHIIDKKTLKIVKTMKPVPGKVSGHVEFDRYGKFAMLSIWEDPGELLIYDAQTLKLHKRIKMRKPSGKYNVFNKIRLSEGTSH